MSRKDEIEVAKAIFKYCIQCAAKINITPEMCPMEKSCPLYIYRHENTPESKKLFKT